MASSRTCRVLSCTPKPGALMFLPKKWPGCHVQHMSTHTVIPFKFTHTVIPFKFITFGLVLCALCIPKSLSTKAISRPHMYAHKRAILPTHVSSSRRGRVTLHRCTGDHPPRVCVSFFLLLFLFLLVFPCLLLVFFELFLLDLPIHSLLFALLVDLL